MSLETGTFSGSQKLPVSRSQTSASFSSCSRFQLIAETRSISFIFCLQSPLHQAVLPAVVRPQTLPLGSDKAAQHKRLCLRVANRHSGCTIWYMNTEDSIEIDASPALV